MFFLSLLLGLTVAGLVHELAHALVGAVMGLAPWQIQLGPVQLTFDRRRVSLRRCRGWVGTGTTVFGAYATGVSLWRNLAVWFAGPLANLLVFGLCVRWQHGFDPNVLLNGWRTGHLSTQMLQFAGYANLCYALMELAPMQSCVHTDGYAIAALFDRNLPRHELLALLTATHGRRELPYGPPQEIPAERKARARLCQAVSLWRMGRPRAAAGLLRYACPGTTIRQRATLDEAFSVLASFAGCSYLHPDLDAATQRLLLHEPHNPVYVAIRGQALAAMGRPGEALPFLLWAIDQVTGNDWNRTAIRLIEVIGQLRQSELYPRAEHLMAMLRMRHPDDTLNQSLWIEHLLYTGRGAQAVQLVEPIVARGHRGVYDIRQACFDCLYTLAVLDQRDLARYPLADVASARTVERDLGPSEFRRARGWLLVEFGRAAEGLAVLRGSEGVVDPGNVVERAEMLATVALAEVAVGEVDAGRRHLAEATAMDPTCRMADRVTEALQAA